jgi:phosphatidylglycerol lysyltransferase
MNPKTPLVPVGCKYFRSQVEMPQALNDRLRRYAQKFGETYAAYLVTEQDREYFWCSEARGVIGFRRLGRYVNVCDGLLAAAADREILLTEFLTFAEQNHWRPTFINVPRTEINMFRRHGCQVTKCGEEPFVRLQRTDWQGKASEWVRRQENFCKRQGVEVCEINPDPADAFYQSEVAPQLDEISRDHLGSTLHGKELHFFVSQFSANQLCGKRLFVAHKDLRITAFIVCNPGLDGDLWAVEVYRRRHDAVRGVIPTIIMHAMRAMKAEGVSYFSLSLAPFLRCTPVMGDSIMFRSVANVWWRFLNPLYDVRGLYHFKSRFRPDYREMYIAAKPGVTIRSLLVIALVWNLFHFNPLRLVQRCLRHKKSANRCDLAASEGRPNRLIRELRSDPAHILTVAPRTPISVVEENQFGETRAQESVAV